MCYLCPRITNLISVCFVLRPNLISVCFVLRLLMLGHFEISVPNDPKMTLNTTRSNVTLLTNTNLTLFRSTTSHFLRYEVTRLQMHSVTSHRLWTFNYCITVWGYAPDVPIDKIQCRQNREARIVCGNYDLTIQSTDIVKLLNWQTVRERRDYLRPFNVQDYGRYSTF